MKDHFDEIYDQLYLGKWGPELMQSILYNW